MKSCRIVVLLLVAQMALLAVSGGSVGAAPLETVIYQDGFTVDGVERQYGGNLNLTTIEGAMLKWNAPTSMVFSEINGQDVVYAASRNGASAVINADLSLVGGTVKIESDVMPLGTRADDALKDDWVAIGFQPGQSSVGHGGASLWMLFRGNGGYQVFRLGTANLLANGSVAGYAQGQVAHISVTYDADTHVATFAVDDQVIHTQDVSGTEFVDAAKRPFIITYDASQWFDNYTVSMEGGVLPVVTVLESPANSVQVPVDTQLSWAAAFPVVQDLTFDVYLDPNEARVTSLDSSALVSSQQSGFSYAVALDYETRYYWRVVPYIDGEPNQPTEVRNFLTEYEVQKWTSVPWMTDADLDLSVDKVYTHAVEFNSVNEAFATRVKGISFENDTNRSGSNWSLTGAPNAHAGTSFTGSGQGVVLNTRFYYGNPSALTLTGLVPGVQYRTTLYTHAWGDPGTRVVAITASDDGKANLLDENVDGGGKGRLFMYTYTAPASGNLTFQFDAVVPANSWHHYSFTNEVVQDIYLDPSPLPGSPVSNNVDLSWQLNGEVANPSYRLYVATDPGFLNVIVDADLADSTYPVSLSPNMNYYWKVVVRDGGVAVHESLVWDITTKWSDAPWMTDDDLDISAGKIYTHKVNFNGVSETLQTTVKGVDFENDTDRSGSNWSLSGAPSAHGGSEFTGSGDGVALNTRFYYGNPSALTLTGLVPGVDYRTTLYTHGWGPAGTRVVGITTSDDGRVNYLDENVGGNGVGRLFMYTYTAPASGNLTLQFNQATDASWHHYSFSNEIAADVYVDPNPLPGSRVPGNLNMSWQLHGQVTNPSYKLYVATDPNMLNLVVQQTIPTAAYSASLNPEVKYYWRVGVVEDGGAVVHTSPVWHFTTSPPPDAEKVLEWTMDETAGPIAYQTGSSEDADGVLMGFNDPNASSMFVPGLVGNALLLNGTSEYVDVSNAHPYMPTGNEEAFAVSAYFRTFKAYGPIFSMRNSANGTPLIDIAIGHDGARESAGRLRMLVRDDGNVLSPDKNSGIVVNDGRWHSLVVMRANGNWLMYVDGVERIRLSGVASGQVTLDWLTIGTEKKWVFDAYGSWNGTRTDIRYFEGMLDEVCVWAGEMRPHQIAELAAKVPPAGDMDFDRDTDTADLRTVAENWLTDSYLPVQPSPLILEDMESYNPADPNSYGAHWEALYGGVSLENVYGNVDAAPEAGLSVNSIQTDSEYGQVLQWNYDFQQQINAIERFWLRDRRIDLAAYDHISIRVKKLPGSTGNQFYIDFHDGRGMTDPENGIYPWVLAWKGRIIMPLANLPEGQWVTLKAAIPGGFNSGRIRECRDLYEVSIGVSNPRNADGTPGPGTTGTILIDEIVLSDSTTNCFPAVGELLPDMNGDCVVNIKDFAIMARNWLMGL
ncbi:MAG: hypothetical protein IH624_10355 [Phycisphaerae bacterium]|nr:hypothetical protein [Phycisphaerae bacterium]